MFCNALQAFHLKEIKDAPVIKRERERARKKEREIKKTNHAKIRNFVSKNKST